MVTTSVCLHACNVVVRTVLLVGLAHGSLSTYTGAGACLALTSHAFLMDTIIAFAGSSFCCLHTVMFGRQFIVVIG